MVNHVGSSSDTNVRCINCNKKGHKAADCHMKRVDCKWCGPDAGHLREYCLVINDGKEIPTWISPRRRAAIEHQRLLYQSVKPQLGGTALICEAPGDEGRFENWNDARA